jgi:hypothetical protein
MIQKRLEPHAAGSAEQVGADLVVFEGGDEEAIRSTRQKSARLAFRMLKGSWRRSSPSASKSDTPSPSTTASRRGAFLRAEIKTSN